MCNVLHTLRVELEREFLHHHHHHHHHHLQSENGPLPPPPALMYTTADQDMVPLAELLAHYDTGDAINYQDPKSEDSVLQRCIACDQVPMAELLMSYTADIALRNQVFPSMGLHNACMLAHSASWIDLMCANGAKVNERRLKGQTPLHIVLLGDIRKCRKHMEDSLVLLLRLGADTNAQDHKGDTPLLYLRAFLKDGAFEAAAAFAQLLLERDADPNVANHEGRSLLTYSVSYLDDSIALTRLLLNHGASVWNDGITKEKEGGPHNESLAAMPSVSSLTLSGGAGNNGSVDHHSAFSWFLKAVIYRRRLENCSETLRHLALVMGESPRRMHAHVLRTMFRHVRCFRVLGPVFLQLKMGMMRHWSQPQGLKYLCWRTIRRSVGPRRLATGGVTQLGLPKPLQNYVLMK